MDTPRPYHHGSLRQALIDAALELVADLGARGFTLREVARKVGVSHNAPYRHFANREELLAAIAAEGFEKLSQTVARHADRGVDPVDRLIAGASAYLAFAGKWRAHYEVMFGASHPAGADPGLDAAAGKAFSKLVEGIRGCQQAGRIRPGDPLEMARLLWSLLHGIASLNNAGRLQEGGARKLAQFGREAVTQLLRGLEHQGESRVSE